MISPHPTDQEFNKKEFPRFIEIVIGDKYLIRLYKTNDMAGGEPVYRMQGTPSNIAAMQADIDSVFPRNKTSG